MSKNTQAWVALLGLFSVLGCANLAVHPPAPAREVDFSHLEEPQPGVRYYVTIFGSQTYPLIPRFTHTWAAFLRLVRFGWSASQFIVDELKRRVRLLNPEQTHNWLNSWLGLDAYPSNTNKISLRASPARPNLEDSSEESAGLLFLALPVQPSLGLR